MSQRIGANGRATLLLAALTAMGPLAIDMYLPALPTIAASFGRDPGAGQLTLSAFFVGFALGQLVYGPLSDRLGRRRPMLAGLALFVGASLLCAAAPAIGALAGLRFLQALGACAGVVLARAMVRDLHEREASARVMSHMMMAMGVAPLLAPLLGGYVLLFVGWRGIFVVLALTGLILFSCAWLLLPESLPPARRVRLSGRQAASAYFSLVRDRAYIGHALSGACALGGMFAYIAGSPFVFIELYGVPPQHYGLLFGANVIGLMCGAFINGRLVPRWGSARILAAAVVVAAAAGTALLLAALLRAGGLPGLMVPLFCYVASISFIGPNAMAGALAARSDLAGTGSALAGTLQFGTGAGVAFLVALLHDGTAVPMAGAIAALGLLSLAVHRYVLGSPPAS